MFWGKGRMMKDSSSIINDMTRILSLIPFEKWEEIVRREPEYDFLEALKKTYEFGPLAVIALVTGLNDYQLKGKAEKVYWPVLKELLMGKQDMLKEPYHLMNYLIDNFYVNERLAEQKIERTQRFLLSRLAYHMWFYKPDYVEKNFKQIWYELATIMYQPPSAKTIAFAMKVLGILLSIYGYHNYDYTGIPVPVDRRIRAFTSRLINIKITHVSKNKSMWAQRDPLERMENEEIRKFWASILENLRKNEPRITMIHLDSLIWQIGTLDKERIQAYFDDLGLHDTGREIVKLLRE